MSDDERHDFLVATKQLLAKRAGYRCSMCDKTTIGPADAALESAGDGIAAHIASASPKSGPRANPSLTEAQRKDVSNGIWLCATHARIIDSDEDRYTEQLLKCWKEDHEERIRLERDGVWVGHGVVKELEVEGLGGFRLKQILAFSSKTLIMGGNTTGKSLICDLLGLLSDPARAQRILPPSNGNPAHVKLSTFSGKRRDWKIVFSDRDSYFLNSKRAPFIFSGFHFIILKDEFVLPVEPECDDQEQLNRSILKAFGQLLGMSWQNVSSVIHALEDEAGVFLPRIRICETEIQAKPQAASDWVSFRNLSSGEKQFLVIEVILRAAHYIAETTPVTVVMEQSFFSSLSYIALSSFIAKLGQADLNHQIILTLYSWPLQSSFEGWRAWLLDGSSLSLEGIQIKPYALESSVPSSVLDLFMDESGSPTFKNA